MLLRRGELAVAGVLMCVGVAIALFVARHYTGTPEFYQAEFGPAVMVAVGRGFVDPVASSDSPVADFLRRRRASLSRADALRIDAVAPPNALQNSSLYLMTTVGWLWKLTGVSWRAVWALNAVFYGLATTAVYAVGRVWLPRAVAAAGALLIAVSPVQLEQMPHLRDYVKVPFIIAGLALTALTVMKPLSRRSLVTVSGVCGAIVGIGIGFRPDVEIVAPLFVASVLLLRAAGPRRSIRDAAIATAAFAASFTIASAPVLAKTIGSGSNPYHAILLGYTEPFDATLRLRPSVYGYGLQYSDGYVAEAVSAYSERLNGVPANYPSDAYNSASRAYWLQIVREFPADVVTRVLAAANGILNLPFQNRTPDFLDARMPGAEVIDGVFAVLRRFDNLGVGVGLLLTVIAAAASWRHALFAVAVVAYLSAITSLDFERRHVFYLQFIPVLAMSLCWCVGAVLGQRRAVGDVLLRSSELRRMIAGGVGIVVFSLTSVIGARAYQTQHVRETIRTYTAAPRTAVVPSFAESPDGLWIAQLNGAPGEWSYGGASHGYYMLEFEWRGAPTLVAIGLRYRARVPPDLSRITAMVADAGTNRFFFPVHVDPGILEFEALELTPPVKRALTGLYRVDDRQLPLPLDLQLAATWTAEPLYETFRQERSPYAHDLRFVDSLDRLSRLRWIGRMDSPALVPTEANIKSRDEPRVGLSAAGTIALDAPAATRSGRVLTFAPVSLPRGGALLATGRLDSGGVALGLLSGNEWARRVEITEGGNFVAILEAHESGDYAPAIGYAAPRAGWPTRFVISRFGAVQDGDRR